MCCKEIVRVASKVSALGDPNKPASQHPGASPVCLNFTFSSGKNKNAV